MKIFGTWFKQEIISWCHRLLMILGMIHHFFSVFLPLTFFLFISNVYSVSISCYMFKPEAAVNGNHTCIILIRILCSWKVTLGTIKTLQHQHGYVNLVLFNTFLYLDILLEIIRLVCLCGRNECDHRIVQPKSLSAILSPISTEVLIAKIWGFTDIQLMLRIDYFSGSN